MAVNKKGINQLVRLSKSLRSMKSPAFGRFLTEGLTETLLGLVDKGFANETDPYGQKWEKLAKSTRKKKGFSDILIGTGDPPSEGPGTLRSSFVVTNSAKGPKIQNRAPYSIFHQQPDKKGKLPRRRMLPDNRSGLPQSWRRPITVQVQKLTKQWFSAKQRGS